MNNLIPLTTTNEGTQAVMGRDLHEFLEIGRDYTNWFKQMAEYGFDEGVDYLAIFGEVQDSLGRTRPRHDHVVTLDMAKEVSMIQRTDKGKQARQYFLEVERRYKAQTPQELTRKQILTMAIEAEERAEALEAKAVEDAPKVDYHDTYVADEDLIQFRTLANQLGVGEQFLRGQLVERGWIYNDRTQRWSNKAGALVWESRWRASSDKKKYFRLVAHHKAPRINGEVRQTLKVTSEGAVAIARMVRRWEWPEQALLEV